MFFAFFLFKSHEIKQWKMLRIQNVRNTFRKSFVYVCFFYSLQNIIGIQCQNGRVTKPTFTFRFYIPFTQEVGYVIALNVNFIEKVFFLLNRKKQVSFQFDKNTLSTIAKSDEQTIEKKKTDHWINWGQYFCIEL